MRGGPLLYPTADLVALWLAVTASFHLRFKTSLMPVFTIVPKFSGYAVGLLIATPFYVLILKSLGAYESRHGKLSNYEIQNLYRSLAFFYILSLGVIVLLHGYQVSRLTVVLSFFLNFLFCVLFRSFLIRLTLDAQQY